MHSQCGFYSWIIKKLLNGKTYFLTKHSPFSTFALINNGIFIDCQKSVVQRYSNGLYWILENSVEHFHTFLKIWTLYTCMQLDLHLQFEHIKLFPRTFFTECWKRLFDVTLPLYRGKVCWGKVTQFYYYEGNLIKNLKGMLQRNIEHFLKIRYIWNEIFFCKNINPHLYILFLFDESMT